MQKGADATIEIDTYQNQDKVFKESMEIFRGGTLEFLGLADQGIIEDILSTEITETATKKAYADKVFRVSNNKGLHIEWEASVNISDMMRFASYNIDLSRQHDIPFWSVIITNEQPLASAVIRYENPSIAFQPKMVYLKERDADASIKTIEAKLAKGEKINPLELLYLPLYHSNNKSERQLLDYAIKTTPKATDGEYEKNKLGSLLLLLMSRFMTRAEIQQVWKENAMTLQGNAFVEIIKEEGKAETALEMLKEGMEHSAIARILKMPLEWVEEIQRTQHEAVV